MCPNTRSQFERGPRMLKDFLLEDLNSCSSTGFKSFPRKPPPPLDHVTRRRVDSRPSRVGTRKLLRRSPSKAASTTISAFQAVINAVKNIQFVKSPSIMLPRSLSRRNSTKNREDHMSVRRVKVTVKDIMRWRSFRDIINVEQHSEPLDFASSPDHHCTATTTSDITTTTTTSSSTCSSTSGWSWCDSDFTAEDLPSWSGNRENDVVDKMYLPLCHKDCVEVTAAESAVEPKGEAEWEEERQQSPISVLDHEFEEEEELDQSLVSIGRTKEKLMERFGRIKRLAAGDTVDLEKWVEEEGTDINFVEEEQEEYLRKEIEENMAWQLLEQVKTTSSVLPGNVEQVAVLLDFFRDELAANTNDKIRHPGSVVIRKARTWLRGEHSTLFELGGDDDQQRRDAYVNDLCMEEGRRRWSQFDEEQNEIAMEVENGLLCDLMDQLLLDILL